MLTGKRRAAPAQPDQALLGGLVCDIVGAVFLFLYGLPADVVRGGKHLIAEDSDAIEQTKKFDRYQRRSRIGLTFLILGFVLQGIGTFLSADPPDPAWVLLHAGAIG